MFAQDDGTINYAEQQQLAQLDFQGFGASPADSSGSGFVYFIVGLALGYVLSAGIGNLSKG